MRRIYRRLFMVVWSLALAITTTAITIAAPAQVPTIADQTGQRKALYQSELEQNLLLRTQLGYGLMLTMDHFGYYRPNRGHHG
jgi:hypothetical protein